MKRIRNWIFGNYQEKKWDLIIFDERHQCFKKYETLKGDKVLLLTATPIVINSNTYDKELKISKVRTLNEYVEMLCLIFDKDSSDINSGQKNS